ncbi:MAG: hypothetical protein LUF00_04565 [Lachnospiraceae bacterium]|nr:hypothetical protein [Lachnospiraceae bacterium]
MIAVSQRESPQSCPAEGILSGVVLYKLAGLHLVSDDKLENSSTFKDKFD